MTQHTLEALVIELETAATYTSNYRNMQKYLKEARDEHKIKLECAINGKVAVLKQECERIASAIRNGTVETAVQNKRKPTAPKKTTKVIEDLEPKVYESVPKQPSAELLLAEANETIARLQRELADKTNEVAAQAEALEHSRATVLTHANTIRSQRKQIQELLQKEQELLQQQATKETIVELENDCDEDAGDAVDELALKIHDGEDVDYVITALADALKRKFGSYKATAFIREYNSMTYETVQGLADEIRRVLKESNVSIDALETALVTNPTNEKEQEYTEADAWVMANRIGLHMLGKPGNYRLQTKEGMIVANKLRSIDSVLTYVKDYSKHLTKA